MFERLRKWNGLLIEADPKNYALLRKKHRKAFTINACLSVHPYPVKVCLLTFSFFKVNSPVPFTYAYLSFI